ncbi:hypothetical protein AYL99_10453 [Fonsecaea erecta]|uniref:Uncharacterized protein n=1 Tax=Fonsecaea erecta TaxID=1367422 RepID=A0A178Z6S6_9EURO|nr:hypothetical protein AYL99_10453 [Fonsecaea erecta]OAP55480.1 hypothetical protein AYL99_10453 [Fonsecaea erecta]
MERRDLDNSDEFNFDHPLPISSSTSLNSTVYINATSLDTGTGSAGHASNNWSQHLTDKTDPFVSGDPSLYRPSSEIDIDGANIVANGAVGDILGSTVPDTDPHRDSLFDQMEDEQLAQLLQAYIERGPSPTQGTDEDWSNMDTTLNSVDQPIDNAVTGVSCVSGVAADAPDIANTPKTNVSAAPPTWSGTDTACTPRTYVAAVLSSSPATPGSASCQLMEAMSRSPIEIPRTSHFVNFQSASPAPKKKARSGKKRSVDHGPTSAETSSQSSPVRQKTSAQQVLGSPFKMPHLPASTPAKQIPSAHASMGTLYSPSPASSRVLSMDNISPWMTALPGYTPVTNNQMQGMADPRSRTMSSSDKSPPDHAGFTSELLSSSGSNSNGGSFLDRDLPSAEQRSAKRARKEPIPAQAVFANAAHEAQMHRQVYFQQVSQARGRGQGHLSLAHHFNHLVDSDFKWLERDRTDPEPPPSEVARTTGFEFPTTLPTGTMASVNKEEQDEQDGEEDDVVFVGQKRKAIHMSRDDRDHNNIIQNPYALAGLGISQPAPQYLGMFIPHTQAQTMSQHGMSVPPQPQFPGNGQTCGKFPGQGQQQAQMHARAHSQGQFTQPMAHSRGLSWQNQSQQQPQGRLVSQHRSVDGQQQHVRSSSSVSKARAPGTPTPSSRHRSTHSKAGQKVVSNSSRSSGTPRKHVQTPSGRSCRTPNHKPSPSLSLSQIPKQTPPNATPAGQRIHLPTPQQPTSTGSCPNTISETLAETNRRTENELRALGADVVDYDPNMSWDDAGVAGGASFETLFGGIGLMTPAEQTFSEMMGLHMSMPAPVDQHLPQNGSGNIVGLGNTLLNTELKTTVSTSGDDAGLFETYLSDSYNHSNHNAKNTPDITESNGVAMADVVCETGAAVPATADLDFESDWTKGFDEDKDFDPMDFGF